MTTFAPGKTYPHGTRASYTNCECRCEACTKANREYSRDYWHRVRVGDNPGRLVPADETRQHLRTLSESGIGKRRVHELSGVALSVIDKIRRGERKHVRWSTEQAIMSVAVDEGALGSLTGKEEAEAIVSRLLGRGWARYKIAGRLGSRAQTPSLQIARSQNITRRTLRKLEVLEQLDLRGLVRP